ncbi:MAG: amidohydrolase, partial [Parasphingorhabdus sp.]
MKRITAIFVSTFALMAAPVAAETIAITGGKVVAGDGSAPMDGATVVIRDGYVQAVGTNVAIPAGARQIDATGKWVTPGIFAGFSRVGLAEVEGVSSTNDINAAGSVFSAALDVQYAVNPFS